MAKNSADIIGECAISAKAAVAKILLPPPVTWQGQFTDYTTLTGFKRALIQSGVATTNDFPPLHGLTEQHVAQLKSQVTGALTAACIKGGEPPDTTSQPIGQSQRSR